MLYMIVCVWSININIKGLSCLLESDPIVVHCVYAYSKPTSYCSNRRGVHPGNRFSIRFIKQIVHIVTLIGVGKIVRCVNWLASDTIYNTYKIWILILWKEHGLETMWHYGGTWYYTRKTALQDTKFCYSSKLLFCLLRLLEPCHGGIFTTNT